MNTAAGQLFDYLRDIIYDPSRAALDPETLPEDFRDLGEGLLYLSECISETRKFANALAKGDLDDIKISAGNEIAAPLKSLHASLRHLTWQTQQVADGDYQQHVDFMGNFSTAFNTMVKQLESRRKMDSDAKSKLQRYVNLMLDNSPDILLLFDNNEHVVSFSKSYLLCSKIDDPETIINKSVDELFTPIVSADFMVQIGKMLRIAVNEKRTTEAEQEIAFGQDGKLRHYVAKITPMMDESFNLMGTMFFFHDITDIREADKRTQLMLDSTPLCANFWDKNINNIDCNQEAIKMFELSGKEEYLEKYHELSPEFQPCGKLSREKMIELVRIAFEEGYCRTEWMHQKLNGEPIPCELILVRVEYKGDYIVAGYTRDLRELKAMISEMRRIDIAEANSEAKSKFLAMISHEIRTPMNAIMGITEIIMRDETLAPNIAEALDMIYSSSNTLLHIINEVLDLSKIESGKLELVPARYEIASLINDTVELNILRFSSKPIEFNLIIDENTPSALIGDIVPIKQILNNLLSNAFKYTERGIIELSVKVEPYIDNAESEIMLVLSVRDTGQGMTPEQIQDLFSEYSRFNYETNRSIEGTGLGMNITQHLIKMMNGDITVESENGKGSLFTVRLQQGNAGAGPLGKELAENLQRLRKNNKLRREMSQIVHEPMPYSRILLVDDVYTNLFVAKELMSPYKMSIDTAMSGFEAIEKIKEGNIYNLIFMDHMMPKMDGIETVKYIRSIGYTHPIVALTANAMTEQAGKFFENGFDGFISKPIDMRQLDDILNNLIRKKQPSSVLEAAHRYNRDLIKKNEIPNETQKIPNLNEIFISDARKAILTLSSLYNNKFRRDDDVDMFVITVHAMKSALANIGEVELSSSAFRLEQIGGREDVETMLAETPKFLNELKDLIDKLKPKNEDKNSEPLHEDEEFLNKKLAIIQTACGVYDKKTIKESLTELKSQSWSNSTTELLNSLSEYLLHSDFDRLAAEAAGFKLKSTSK